jgi:hypothetical protein
MKPGSRTRIRRVDAMGSGEANDMAPQALMLSLLCTFRPALVLPTVDIPGVAESLEMDAARSVVTVERDDSAWLSRGGVGVHHIAAWLLSASVYGLALTASLPEIIEGDPLLTVVRIARGDESTGSIKDIGPLAASLARSVGVVMVSLEDDDVASTGRRGVRIALLPIGPANSAGLSVSGAFL